MRERLIDILNRISASKIMVVSKSSFARYGLDRILSESKQEYVVFDDYNPNPDYEDIVNGVQIFVDERCDALLAIGGGSTIDVAKCIKAYCSMDHRQDYMEQKIVDNGVPFVAIPTTAGSGSEVTPNAVIYRKKVKQSVADPSLKPGYVILDGHVLESLPDYQKKCTVLDALAQGIEAWWSLKSTEESREYSKQAVTMIMSNIRSYVAGDKAVNQEIIEASSLAGKAIAIAGTTVPHAMSYRLTGLYGIAHGHSVALSLPKVWKSMSNITDMENGNLEAKMINDSRGITFVREIFTDISKALGAGSTEEAIEVLENLLAELDIGHPQSYDIERDVANLTDSVPASKLATNPVITTAENIDAFYREIVDAVSSPDYEWAKELCRCAGEEESLMDFWKLLCGSPKVMSEFTYYRINGQFLGEYSVAGMTLIDNMIWQMDHFKSDLDRGLFDMKNNPDKMILKAFETMLNMEISPQKYIDRFAQDTGSDYPDKY